MHFRKLKRSFFRRNRLSFQKRKHKGIKAHFLWVFSVPKPTETVRFFIFIFCTADWGLDFLPNLNRRTPYSSSVHCQGNPGLNSCSSIAAVSPKPETTWADFPTSTDKLPGLTRMFLLPLEVIKAKLKQKPTASLVSIAQLFAPVLLQKSIPQPWSCVVYPHHHPLTMRQQRFKVAEFV